MAKPKSRTRKAPARFERITILPRFKPGARVTWNDGTRERTGVARDVHKLGGHGYAYEVIADGETLPDEITEVELAPEPPHKHPALRELLAAVQGLMLSTPETQDAKLARLSKAGAAWIAQGRPGIE